MAYRILEAERAADAIRAWDYADGRIDLLLTDVVMPGGIEPATRLAQRAPGLKVMFASRYSRNCVGQERTPQQTRDRGAPALGGAHAGRRHLRAFANSPTAHAAFRT